MYRRIITLSVISILCGYGAQDELILRHADTNMNEIINNELVSTLGGHVLFEYDDILVSSRNARMWNRQGIVKLNDSVRVDRGRQKLTCNTMTMLKEKNLLTAAGTVVYDDDEKLIRLLGRKVDYDMKRRFMTVTGEPRFFRFDTLAAETLSVTGAAMTWDDSLSVATVRDSVRITRGPLFSRCRRATYGTKDSRAYLRGEPYVTYDIHDLDGDSMDLLFVNDTLRGLSVDGDAHGIYREPSKSGPDTSVTHIWSDSMYMALSPRGNLDSLYAVGSVESRYFLSARKDSADEVKGKTMVLAFNGEGDLTSAVVSGNAWSTYFIREEEGSGRNESSGDSITVYFNDGEAVELYLTGGVRGTYYGEK